MRRVFTSLDSNKDGLVDQTSIENQLSSLGLAHSNLNTLKGMKADDAGFARFRRVIGIQLAFQKLAEHSPFRTCSSSVEVLDYKRDATECPFQHRIAWREGDAEKAGQNQEWKDFMLKPRAIAAEPKQRFTRWMNVVGLDSVLLRQLAVRYELDPLAIEDALQKEQRPKVEEYNHGLFIVVPMLAVRTDQNVQAGRMKKPIYRRSRAHRLSSTPADQSDNNDNTEEDGDEGGDGASQVSLDIAKFEVETESVSIFVIDEERTVLTVQEKEGDCWGKIRKQLKHSYARIRRSDHNFLLYSLLDATVDALFPVVDWVLKRINELDDELANCSGYDLTKFNIEGVRNVRKQLNSMHQTLRPMKEVLLKAADDMAEDGAVEKGNSSALMSAKYMRDVYSHIIQILEDIEVGQQECRDLTDLYSSKIDNRQADVLYVLTFVTIFITPIQLMSGIYGMNFAYIPELEWYGGYAYFWGTSLLLMMLLAFGFVKMGWLQVPWWLGACFTQQFAGEPPGQAGGR